MNWILLPIGAVIVLVVMWDVFVTTLAVATSGGPVSGRIAHIVWIAGLRVGRRPLLQVLGVALTLGILTLWLVALWVGWSLIFSADPTAVVSESSRPAAFWQRVYFTGTTLFTLGNAEFRPHGSPWQIVTVVALLNGLGLMSLGITYLIPVTSAATERRQLATSIAALGPRPDDPLLIAWNGDRLDFLAERLLGLERELDLLSQRHLAYPVLHFFVARSASNAAAPMIARLDETVTILRSALADEARLPKSAVEPLHASLTQFLDTLRSAFITASGDAPAPADLSRLREAGIPVVDDDTFARRMEPLAERRRLLASMVRADGWSWQDVWGSDDHAELDRDDPKITDV